MSLRTAAIEFVAAENVTDREELLFRAHRHASNLTGQLPVPVAQRAVQSFVAAVNREFSATCCDSDSDGDCDGCGATKGEDCRPWCGGKEKDEDKSDNKKKGHRTASVSDFPDELMY